MKQLHLISYPHFFVGEAEAITAILGQCDVVLHLRKPEADDSSYEQLLSAIPSRLYKQIILHSAYHLAEEYDFAGLHFSTKKRALAGAYGENVKKSTSCHSLDEVSTLSSKFDACFLSPLFPSISKQGYASDLDHQAVANYLKSPRQTKVIALGGIDATRVEKVQTMGFDAMAVLGAVWGDSPQLGDDFVGRLQTILHKIQRPFCLTIAGFDPTSGAGVSSDIKTFEANGAYSLGVTTAITYQNDDSFDGVEWMSLESIKAQLCPLSKYKVEAIKVGLIESFAVLQQVVTYVKKLFPQAFVIWDPILKASAGFEFHGAKSIETSFLQDIDLITPNAEEFEQLRMDVNHLATAVLLKGGHRSEKLGVDTLFLDGDEIDILGQAFKEKKDKHGTGCVLSSAIAANLAFGESLEEAARHAKHYVEDFIQSNASRLGYHSY